MWEKCWLHIKMNLENVTDFDMAKKQRGFYLHEFRESSLYLFIWWLNFCEPFWLLNHGQKQYLTRQLDYCTTSTIQLHYNIWKKKKSLCLRKKTSASISLSFWLFIILLDLEIRCVEGSNLWRTSSSEINDEIYRGYMKGNSEEKINEIVAG